LVRVALGPRHRQGVLHVCYLDWDARDIRYMRHDGGGWTSELVESTGDVGWGCAITLDPTRARRPAITYRDRDGGRTRFARKEAGGSWTRETIDADVGTFMVDALPGPTAVGIDPLGQVHATYQEWTGRTLRYAVRCPD